MSCRRNVRSASRRVGVDCSLPTHHGNRRGIDAHVLVSELLRSAVDQAVGPVAAVSGIEPVDSSWIRPSRCFQNQSCLFLSMQRTYCSRVTAEKNSSERRFLACSKHLFLKNAEVAPAKYGARSFAAGGVCIQHLAQKNPQRLSDSYPAAEKPQTPLQFVLRCRPTYDTDAILGDQRVTEPISTRSDPAIHNTSAVDPDVVDYFMSCETFVKTRSKNTVIMQECAVTLMILSEIANLLTA